LALGEVAWGEFAFFSALVRMSDGVYPNKRPKNHLGFTQISALRAVNPRLGLPKGPLRPERKKS
jgi:hypothetical protein